MAPEGPLRLIAGHMSEEDAGYTSACWITDYRMNNRGYPMMKLRPDPSPKLVHRVMYEAMVCDIPQGLVIDHLCRNRRCCNPEHLEPVTTRVNLLRGETSTAANAAKTYCIHGHEYTPENTYRRRDGGFRQCRMCGKQQRRERTLREREARK